MDRRIGNYSLFSGDTLNKIQDFEWFYKCVSYEYNSFASRYKCKIELSKKRVRQAHGYYLRDAERFRNYGIEGNSDLDHFKHAGILAYWLRRRMIINTVIFEKHPSLPDEKMPFPVQEDFSEEYENEYCAFLFGLKICSHYEGKATHDNIANTFARDITTVMRHKNVSPHALIMIYRSLFMKT